ncbi:MAG: hypothetical protein AB7N91_32275 [Candidatus Tectimicrobiota bacterium]
MTTGTLGTEYTDLLGSQRVPTFDPRPEAFDTVDEATSALGMARAAVHNPQIQAIIYQIQEDLYYLLLMGELATPPENYDKMGLRMPAQKPWVIP